MPFTHYTPFTNAEYPCYWLSNNGIYWENDTAKKLPAIEDSPSVASILEKARAAITITGTPFSLPLPSGEALTILPSPDGLFAISGNDTLLSTSLVGSEMRESLTGIFAVLPLLARKVDHTGLAYTEEIQNSCYTLLRLASNLENSSSVTRRTGNEKPVDVTALVESLLHGIETVCQEQNISFEAKIPSYSLPARGDKRIFTEAFLNILRNSLQYTRDGNHIAVRLFEAGGQAILTIHDRGLGIKSEYLPYIFSPYFSADPYADGSPSPGIGLGLAVAYQAARSFGGTITAESKFGEGTRIALALPLDDSTEEIMGSAPADYLLNRYSPIYVQLSGFCRFPDL